MSILDRFADKLKELRSWFERENPPSYGIEHGFVPAVPMTETAVRQVEEEFQISLPSEYRSFLLRFGNGKVGPGRFHPLKEGLSSKPHRPFPLTSPRLGFLSPTLFEEPEDNGEWEELATEDGVLWICDYGCDMYGRLILNGPFQGKVWMLAPESDYYGPFGGWESLHDESAEEVEPTASPREYSFFEWYESWLDGQLKFARVAC